VVVVVVVVVVCNKTIPLFVQITAPELGALVKLFDKKGVGTVATSEFLVDFFRRGFERKTKMLKKWRAEEAKKEAARKVGILVIRGGQEILQ